MFFGLIPKHFFKINYEYNDFMNQVIYKKTQAPKTSLIENRQWQFLPTCSFPIDNLSKTIRIDIMGASKGLFDPKNSYIQVQVGIPQSTTVGGIRLDTCQQSLIQNFRWLSGGKQIQRVNQINKLQPIHHAMGKLSAKRNQNDVVPCQKLKYKSRGSSYQNSITISNGSQNNKAGLTGFLQSSGIVSTQNPEPICGGSKFSSDGDSSVSVQQIQRNVNGHLSTQNPFYCAQDYKTSDLQYNQTNYPAYYQNQFGSFKNKRADYLNAIKGGQPTWALNKNSMRVSQNTNQGNFPFYYKPGLSYEVQFPQKRQTLYSRPDIQNYTRNIDVSNKVQYCGYSDSFAEQYFSYDPAFVLSQTIPSVNVVNGKFLQYPIPLKTKVLRIPIPSSVIGVFIPEHQQRRIPLVYLNQSTIEITFNKYAFYSTGRKDLCQVDQDGIQQQISRQYVVKACKLVFDWYQYNLSPQAQFNLLNGPLIMETDVWQPLQTNTVRSYQVAGVKQISLPYGRLTQIVMFFNSLDYLKYDYCRQNFRLNMGITSLQARYMGRYYPPTPIEGDSSNYELSEQGDNYMFLSSLKKSKLYHPRFCNINGYNFAVNERNYDVSDTTTLYQRQTLRCMNLGVKDGSMDKIFTSHINNNTAMGQSQMHELQCVGKSVFVIPFNQQIIQGQEKSNSFLTGEGGKVIQIEIQTSKQVDNVSAQMNIWGCFRRVVQVNRNDKTKVQIIN